MTRVNVLNVYGAMLALVMATCLDPAKTLTFCRYGLMVIVVLAAVELIREFRKPKQV